MSQKAHGNPDYMTERELAGFIGFLERARKRVTYGRGTVDDQSLEVIDGRLEQARTMYAAKFRGPRADRQGGVAPAP